MKGKAVAGLVLTIVGVVFGILGGLTAVTALLGLPVSIVGLCLSISGGKGLKAAGQPAGVATAGLVLGIIGVVFTAITFFTCGICYLCAGAAGSAVDSALKDLL